MTGSHLDDAMREVLAQLALCAAGPSVTWTSGEGPTWRGFRRSEAALRSQDADGAGPADSGADGDAASLALAYKACETDDERAEVLQWARDELAHRRGQVDRPEATPEGIEERAEEMLRLGEGMPAGQAAQRFGYGLREVRALRRAAGREPAYGFFPVSLTNIAERRERAQALRAAGCTIAQVSGLLGVSRSTAERDLGLRGTPRSTPSPGSGNLSGTRSVGDVRPRTDQRGHVYFVQLPEPPHLIKIGFTRNLKARLSQLRANDPIEVLGFFEGSPLDEQMLHRLFAANRARGREWYEPIPELRAIAESHSAALDGVVHQARVDQARAIAIGRPGGQR